MPKPQAVKKHICGKEPAGNRRSRSQCRQRLRCGSPSAGMLRLAPCSDTTRTATKLSKKAKPPVKKGSQTARQATNPPKSPHPAHDEAGRNSPRQHSSVPGGAHLRHRLTAHQLPAHPKLASSRSLPSDPSVTVCTVPSWAASSPEKHASSPLEAQPPPCFLLPPRIGEAPACPTNLLSPGHRPLLPPEPAPKLPPVNALPLTLTTSRRVLFFPHTTPSVRHRRK